MGVMVEATAPTVREQPLETELDTCDGQPIGLGGVRQGSTSSTAPGVRAASGVPSSVELLLEWASC